MPETVKIDSAALERMIDERLRKLHDNRTGSGVTDPERRAPAGTWRGSANPNTYVSKLSAEDAANVMGFLRGMKNGDHVEMKRALGALGHKERLQQVGINQDGGVTVPYQFLNEVTVALPRVTPFADKAIVRIIPMDSETTRWTKVTQKPATPPIVAEGGTYTTGGVQFGLIELVARKIGQIIPLTEEILASNQIDMVSLIAELVAEQLAYKRNGLVTNGSGSGEPEGVMTNANIGVATWVATNDSTKADSIITIFHSLQSQYRGDAIWLMPDATIQLVRKLKDAQNRYLWVDGFGANPGSLMGRPVYENSDMTSAQILFGNFRRGYVIGERAGLQVEMNSSGTDWTKDIVNFKFRQRYDGKVNDEKSFVKCTNVS